jgi:hypothetical protein
LNVALALLIFILDFCCCCCCWYRNHRHALYLTLRSQMWCLTNTEIIMWHKRQSLLYLSFTDFLYILTVKKALFNWTALKSAS